MVSGYLVSSSEILVAFLWFPSSHAESRWPSYKNGEGGEKRGEWKGGRVIVRWEGEGQSEGVVGGKKPGPGDGDGIWGGLF